MIENQKKIWKL